MKKKKKPVYSEVIADWKEFSGDVKKDLIKALKKFDLHVVDAGEGSDTYHLLISKEKITKKQAEAIVWKEDE